MKGKSALFQVRICSHKHIVEKLHVARSEDTRVADDLLIMPKFVCRNVSQNLIV